MAKKTKTTKPAPVTEKVTKPAPEETPKGLTKESAKPDIEVDALNPAHKHLVKLPTSPRDAYEHKAEVYGIKGRDGSGPCTVLDRGPVMMPNGDLAVEGRTFCPMIERMSPARYTSLVERKFISALDDEALAKWSGEIDKRG